MNRRALTVGLLCAGVLLIMAEHPAGCVVFGAGAVAAFIVWATHTR